MMTINTAQELTLGQVVKTTKILEKLFDSFSKTAKDSKTDLLNQNYFNAWAAQNLTLPKSVLSADHYSFMAVPPTSPITAISAVLMPLALEGLLTGKTKPEIIKKKNKTYTLTFIYEGGRQVFDNLDNYAEAVHTFEKFKKTESLNFYLGLTTLHEQKLFRYLIDPAYVVGEVTNDAKIYPAREAGKKTWQYNAWLRLTAGLKAEGIDSETYVGLRTTSGKFVHSDLLDYQKFYPLISHIRGLTDIKDAVLVHDFFNDGFINGDSLFYLPKRLIQNYSELKVKTINPAPNGSYRVVSRNLSGCKVHIGVFKTFVEAEKTLIKYKITVLEEVFNTYRGFLPAHFCERFDRQLRFLKEGTEKC